MQDENFKALKKEETDLDDRITKTIQEYEEALIDAKICMETEEQIQNLEIQIANNKETFKISFNALKASHQKEKEVKQPFHKYSNKYFLLMYSFNLFMLQFLQKQICDHKRYGNSQTRAYP